MESGHPESQTRRKDGDWRVLRQLPGGEDIQVGTVVDEEEFTRELRKGISGGGNSLCNHNRQERARHVLSYP